MSRIIGRESLTAHLSECYRSAIQIARAAFLCVLLGSCSPPPSKTRVQPTETENSTNAAILPKGVVLISESLDDPCPDFLGIHFISIPSGQFNMGSQDGFRDERPVTNVALPSFCVADRQIHAQDLDSILQAIGDFKSGIELASEESITLALNMVAPKEAGNQKAQISQFQESIWREPTGQLDEKTLQELREAVSGRNLSSILAESRSSELTPTLNWLETTALIKQLSSSAGIEVRLPTEAEWERMARGGLEGKYTPWGNRGDRVGDFDVSSYLDGIQCNSGEFFRTVTPPKNAYQIGELFEGFEWTLSVYAAYPFKHDPQRDDVQRLDFRSIRGNGGAPEQCQFGVAFRGYGAPTSRFAIRLAYSPK